MSAAICATHWLCTDIAHSTACGGKALHITAVLKRSQTNAILKHKKNKPRKLRPKKTSHFLQFIKTFFMAGTSLV